MNNVYTCNSGISKSGHNIVKSNNYDDLFDVYGQQA